MNNSIYDILFSHYDNPKCGFVVDGKNIFLIEEGEQYAEIPGKCLVFYNGQIPKDKIELILSLDNPRGVKTLFNKFITLRDIPENKINAYIHTMDTYNNLINYLEFILGRI